MSRWYVVACVAGLVAGCGSSSSQLRSSVHRTTWYASPSSCGQGPYELVVPAVGHRWGEAVEVVVQAPRRVQFTVAVSDGSGELARQTSGAGRGSGKPDNQRCVAKLGDAPPQIGPGTAGGGGTTTGTGTVTGEPDTERRPPPSRALRWRQVGSEPPSGCCRDTVVKVERSNPTLLPPRFKTGTRLRIRLWSTLPNDLEDVFIGVRQLVFQPEQGDAAFEAYLKEKEAERRRRDAEYAERRRRDAERRRAEPPPPPVTDGDDHERDLRERAERAERQRREAEAEAERQRQRKAYCDAHLQDTSCWGPGGFEIHAQLQRRAREREQYCGAHPEDARCWSEAEWARHRRAWSRRVGEAKRAAAGPTEAPPPPRDESQPPTPSVNAAWRPGYWHWGQGTWHWIAGQWRVPETDVSEGLTTRAPEAPPPQREEAPPPPPVPNAVWVAGYWQWDGSAFVWVPGSWQLPPQRDVTWQPARWVIEVSGSVFVPGGWIPRR